MARFFVTKDDITDNRITISDKDAFHIARSLRMAVGDKLTVCDEDGTEYLVELTRIRDNECIASVISSSAGKTESPVHVTLFMAYPKGDKLETVVQKSVELGASEIIPFESSRCIKRPAADKADKITERLSRIAEEAAKQCGRAKIPTVTPPVSYRAMLDMAGESALALFCYESEDGSTIKDCLSGRARPESISVIVGSEGGFSPDEVAEAKAAGCVSVSLGGRILRCETAPSFALSAISYEYEL